MHNLDTNPRSTVSELSANLALLEAGLDEVSYNTWCPASVLEDAQVSVSPVYTLGSTNNPPYWAMPDASYTAVSYHLRRRSTWYLGALSVEAHYMVKSGGGDVCWHVGITPLVNATAVAAPTFREVVLAAGDTSTVPYVAILDSADIRIDSNIDQSRLSLLVTVGRLGTSVLDTNSGDVELNGINIIYHEAKRTIGVKYSR